MSYNIKKLNFLSDCLKALHPAFYNLSPNGCYGCDGHVWHVSASDENITRVVGVLEELIDVVTDLQLEAEHE